MAFKMYDNDNCIISILHLITFINMIQSKYSLMDFKQENLYLHDNSQFPVTGDSNQIKGFRFIDHRFLKIEAYSFIVDWQLHDTEIPEGKSLILNL